MKNYILGFDTSGKQGLIFLLEDFLIVERFQFSDSKDQISGLHEAVSGILANQNIKLQDLSAIAVISGPGSYTGLRVSLSAVKAYALVHQIPVIDYNKLDIICFQVFKTNPDTALWYSGLVQARPGEYFITIRDNQFNTVHPALYIKKDDLIRLGNQYDSGILTGILAEQGNLAEELDDLSNKFIYKHLEIDPAFWALLIHKDFSIGAFKDAVGLKAYYMKDPYIIS